MNDPRRASLGEAVLAGVAVAAAVTAVILFPGDNCPSGAELRLWFLACLLPAAALVLAVVAIKHKGPARVVLYVATSGSTVTLILGVTGIECSS